MKQFKLVFLVMCSDHDSAVHRTQMESPMCKSIMIGVKDIEDACAQAKQLVDGGAVRCDGDNRFFGGAANARAEGYVFRQLRHDHTGAGAVPRRALHGIR